MFDKTVGRRIAGSLLLAVLTAIGGYQLAWHKDVLHGHNPLVSLGWLALVVLVIALLVWAVRSHSAGKTVLAFVLGLVTAGWGTKVLSDIKWGELLLLAGVLAGFILLIAFIALDTLSLPRLHFHPARHAVSDEEHEDPTVVDPHANGSATLHVPRVSPTPAST